MKKAKLLNKKPIKNIDYADFKKLVNLNEVNENEERYGYQLENRNGVRQIVEIAYKPNTNTCMSVPLPIYNEYIELISQKLTNKGIRGNDLVGEFKYIVDRYRRTFLGETTPLKGTSYQRYLAVIHRFWCATNGKMGIKSELIAGHTERIIEQKGTKCIIENLATSTAYYIKPSGQPILRFIDKEQTNLLGFD